MPTNKKIPTYRHSSRGGFSSRFRIAMAPKQNGNNKSGEALTTWLDILAKSVVVITALLYIVGRHYTESYYATMRLAPSNLPISAQEYLFMSTRSLSFLQKALSTSVYSFVIGILINFVQDIISSELNKRDNNDIDRMPNPSVKKKRNLFERLFVSEKGESFNLRLWKWLKSNLYYAIPTFIVLSFVFLLPGAEESGKIDAQEAMESAPVGSVLLSQPSISGLVPTAYPTQFTSPMYGYDNVQVIGSLGNQWLLLVYDSHGSSSIISVPDSQIVSIRYVGTPTPSPTPQATVTVSATVTAQSTITPTP